MMYINLVHPKAKEPSVMSRVLRERGLSLSKEQLAAFKREVMDFCYDNYACRDIGVRDVAELPDEDLRRIYNHILDHPTEYNLQLPNAA
jgi:uncharacterized protein YdhG (YjbR/CyaY superfamily)